MKTIIELFTTILSGKTMVRQQAPGCYDEVKPTHIRPFY